MIYTKQFRKAYRQFPASQEYDKPKLIELLIEAIENLIYTGDLKPNGKPKIDWITILTKLGELLGFIIRLIELKR